MNDPPIKNEKQVIESLKQGDCEAFDRLFRGYNQRLYYFALSILKNREDARDVVQEVFLRVFRNVDSINPDCSFKSYLFTISYNIIVDTMRKKLSAQQFRDYLVKNAIQEESPVAREVEFNELNTLYTDAIEKLPPQRKKIYKLHRFESLSYEEIATNLGISVHTVKSQMNKALSFIRNKIGTQTLVGLLFLSLYL